MTDPTARLPAGAVLTGHVDRLALFRRFLDDVVDISDLPAPAIRGEYEGTELLVVGTGMGGPAIARVAVALVDGGCRVIVRAGGAGPVQGHIRSGDLIIASAAVRHEGTSSVFLDPSEPAVADPAVLRALIEAASALGLPALVGIGHSKDSFFGQVDPDYSPQSARLHELRAAWQRLGVLGSEMEAAALFAVARALGVRSGAVLRVNDVRNDSGSPTDAQLQLCLVASRATAAVIRETTHA